MKNLLLLILPALYIITSCNSHNNNATTSSRHSSQGASGDSARYGLSIVNGCVALTPEPGEVIGETIQAYKNKVNLDSSFVLGKDTIFLSLKYYCTMDSAIVIPAIFLEAYQIDSFVTHNNNLELRIRKNGIETLNKLIRKSDFDEQIPYDNLRTYGVILQPYIKSDKHTINICFSFSIPLTDFGIRVDMNIDNKGALHWQSSSDM